MALPRSHFVTSVLLGGAYAAAGIYFFNIYPENALLASVIIVVAGMVPNLDGGQSGPAREIGGLIAAMVPLVLLSQYPFIKEGGITRIAIIAVVSYLATRTLFVNFFEQFTTHRGMLHSIPSAVITSELFYLLFFDLRTPERIYISVAALLGFLTHLIMDAYGNVSFLAKGEKKPAALKLFGPSWESNIALYGIASTLGWLVVKDLYPTARLAVGFQ